MCHVPDERFLCANLARVPQKDVYFGTKELYHCAIWRFVVVIVVGIGGVGIRNMKGNI